MRRQYEARFWSRELAVAALRSEGFHQDVPGRWTHRDGRARVLAKSGLAFWLRYDVTEVSPAVSTDRDATLGFGAHPRIDPRARMVSGCKELERVGVVLAREIDEILFGGRPPTVVSFRAIYEARGGTAVPSSGTAFHLSADALMSDGTDPVEQSTSTLIAASTAAMARALRTLETIGASEHDAVERIVMSTSRVLSWNWVVAAHRCGLQLLVLELALAAGIDPLPFPGSVVHRGGSS
jgi:hypothetical protein